ncbi:MAG: signal recognition particle-docking protein FtsY [Nitrospinota bacterium]|nr:signal recognition particle-docking protein FtsY [Nitrospinota bacterium]
MFFEREDKSQVLNDTDQNLFFKGLSLTRNKLFSKLKNIFSNDNMDEKTFEQIEEALYVSDLGPRLVSEVLKRLRSGEGVEHSSRVRIQQILLSFFPEAVKFSTSTRDECSGPKVILLVGVNGVGKTTTAGKLASREVSQGKKVMLVGADTFRAAATEQINFWAQKVGCDFASRSDGADPSSVVFDALESGNARRLDTIIIDTAGRLQNKKNLMEEIKKIHRVCGKVIQDSPHEVFLVIDANTGLNSLNQVKEFNSCVELTGLIMTKVEGTSKGGVIVSASSESGVPIYYLGVGEGVQDLVDFDPHKFVRALLEP